ncbi:MAG: hypothetical protein ABW194_02435 [Novosphingobium sp.]
MGIEISVTEFKAKCLELFDKLSRHEIDSIAVTKRGKTVGMVLPPKNPPALTFEQALADYHEWLKTKPISTVQLDPEWDLTSPTSSLEEFDAHHGRVFPEDE